MLKKLNVNNFKHIYAPALLLAMTFGVCGPIQLYLTNMSELWFSIGDIWWLCLLCGVIVFVVCSAIGLLLPARVSHYYGAVLFGLSLGLYIQGNFVPTDYGVLDGSEIDWDNYRVTAVINTALWIICIGAPVVFAHLRSILAKQILPIASILIAAMQVVTVGILLVTNNFGANDVKGYLSDQGLNTVSSKENVVVFILDTFDQDYFDEIYSSDPDFLQPLDGFTYFDNFTGMYPTTKGSLPYILTGQVYQNEQPYMDYVEEAYRNTDFYSDLLSAGYDIGLYTGSLYVPSNGGEYFINYVDKKMVVSSYTGLASTLYKFVGFRYFPHILKEYFWLYSGDFDQWQTTIKSSEYGVFSSDNINYYTQLKNSNLEITDDVACYRLIHLRGVHSPFTMDENINEVTDGTDVTAVDAAKGCLKIVYSYLEQLKAHELYDNSTIVVMADHGVTKDKPTNPLFIVKPRQSTGGLKISSAPVCQGDLMATIMEDIGLNLQGKYGQSAFEIKEGDDRERKFLYYSWDNSWDSAYLPKMFEYYIDPESNDTSSFHLANYEAAAYQLGDIIDFSRGGTSKQYCIDGFSNPEETFTWSSADSAVMAFQLATSPKRSLLVRFNFNRVFTNSQRLIVKVSDEVLFDADIQSGGTVQFVIPHQIIAETKLELDFEFPGAVSPYELGQGSDTRRLAFAFQTMTIEETDLTPAELEASLNPSYTLGTKILFTDSDDGRVYFDSGISGIERDFAWSVGKEGQMTIPLGETSADLLAHFTFKSVYSGEQSVVVKSNGITLYDGSVTKASPTLEFVIPEECIQDGKLVLQFYYDDAVAPADVDPDSTDTRVLAVAYSEIVFTEASDASAQEAVAAILNRTVDFIDFSVSGNCETYLGSGWWGQEEKGRWTSGSATLSLPAADGQYDFLDLQFHTYAHSGDTRVLVNGQEATVLEHDPKAHTIRIPLDGFLEGDIQEITFETADTTSPQAAGESTDDRALGIFVYSMQLGVDEENN